MNEITYEEKFSRHSEEGRFLPIRIIRGFAPELIAEITLALSNIITTQFSTDQTSEESISYFLEYCISELVENIERHSDTNTVSTVVAQAFPSKNQIKLCVIDNGIGIPNSLRKNKEYESWSDEVCILKSTELGVNSKVFRNPDDPVGRGYGLSQLKRMVEVLKGDFSITCDETHGMFIMTTQDYYRPIKMMSSWNGTIIELNINVIDAIATEEVMGEEHIPVSMTLQDKYDIFS